MYLLTVMEILAPDAMKTITTSTDKKAMKSRYWLSQGASILPMYSMVPFLENVQQNS